MLEIACNDPLGPPPTCLPAPSRPPRRRARTPRALFLVA